MGEELKVLTKEQAIELVGGKRDYIHCFKNPNGMLLGADWKWEKFEELLDEVSTDIKGIITHSGQTATNMKHPLAVFQNGSWNFFGAGL